MNVAEVFGHPVDSDAEAAKQARAERSCPFKGGRCTKGGLANPLGICSYRSGSLVGTVCPRRFEEGNRMFVDAARLAFGKDARVAVVPEVRVLKTSSKESKKIGKVDFMLVRLDRADKFTSDFCALEVQSVYMSGESMKGAVARFLDTGSFGQDDQRRLDPRSSAQKRLAPQLALKVPVFRRWGKKFFVAIDSFLYGHLPSFRKEQDIGNSELTWLVYSFACTETSYAMQTPDVHFSIWDEVVEALREGIAPTTDEVVREIEKADLARRKRSEHIRIET